MRRMLASRGFTAMRSSSSHRMIRTGTPPMRGAFASSSMAACSSLIFRVWAGSTVKTALLYSIRLTMVRRAEVGIRMGRLSLYALRLEPLDAPPISPV